jgi:hypothetical protein
LVNVPGEVRYGVEIENLTVPKFVWRGPIDLGMQVKNTGTVHYDSQADITLKGVLIGGEAKVDMGQHTILPDSSRAYKGEWESKYPFGIYKVTASATGGEASPVTQSTTVYAIPIIIVLPIIIAIILIAIIARSLKKKYKIVSK